MTFVNLKPPVPPKGRVLTCTGCREPVEVYEAPADWISASEYECVACSPATSASVLLDEIRAAKPASYFQARLEEMAR